MGNKYNYLEMEKACEEEKLFVKAGFDLTDIDGLYMKKNKLYNVICIDDETIQIICEDSEDGIGNIVSADLDDDDFELIIKEVQND